MNKNYWIRWLFGIGMGGTIAVGIVLLFDFSTPEAVLLGLILGCLASLAATRW